MVSQFVSPHKVGLLGDISFPFPPGTHAVGRLDNHSEGLLILTTNKKVTRLLFQSDEPHTRTYLVQVKGQVTSEVVERLATGVHIRIKSGVMYRTPPCNVAAVEKPDYGFVPAELSKPHGLSSWLSIGLREGKYHQVRKMVAAAGHKCQRLIRTSIEGLALGDLAPGAVREFEEAEFFRALCIQNWKG